MKSKHLKTLVKTAVLGAFGFILMMLEFPILPGAPFLKLSFGDLPPLMAAFAMGPLAGMGTALVQNLLHLFVSETGGVGELANVLVSGAFVLTAGLFYKRRRTVQGALIALLIGSVCMILFAALTNRYIMLPMYMQDADSSFFWTSIKVAILPFNTIKALIVSAVALLIYKPLSPLLKK